MEERIKALKAQASEAIKKAAGSLEELDEIRVQFLGKKGELTSILRGMGAVAKEERPRLGKIVNEARSELEKLAFENGNGQAAPAQRLLDFLENKKSTDLPPSSYTPGLVSSNLQSWLEPYLTERLVQGFKNFDKNMQGFICKDALLIAIETRTSTPVRILRNKESFECTGLKGLFPVGEGSGYSGGIVSSAMDGENACRNITLLT